MYHVHSPILKCSSTPNSILLEKSECFFLGKIVVQSLYDLVVIDRHGSELGMNSVPEKSLTSRLGVHIDCYHK